VFDWSENFLA